MQTAPGDSADSPENEGENALVPALVPALDQDDVAALDQETVPALTASAGTPLEWRTEVTRRGKFWQWRKGRNQGRVSRYGGKFDLLSDERKAEYHANKRKQAKRRKAQTRASTDAGR